jgi:hypothetical protein
MRPPQQFDSTWCTALQRFPNMKSAPEVEHASRAGRRAGYVVLGILVSAFTAVCALEIIQQVWFHDAGPQQADCRAGLLRLIGAVDRARAAAMTTQVGDDEAALARFRSSLDPEWEAKAAVTAACKADPKTMNALKQIEQLRYAEEHAVRYEARNLSRQRRQVERTLSELGLLPAPRHPLPRGLHDHE